MHVAVREIDHPKELGVLEPLFKELHAHQTQVTPRLGHMVPRDERAAWARRLDRYRTWLASPGAFVLVASADGAALGYALVTLGEAYDGWESGDRVADVRDFVVTARARGTGIGSQLLAAVRKRLAALGIDEFRIRVIVGNESALEFYRARGLREVGHTLLGTTS